MYQINVSGLKGTLTRPNFALFRFKIGPWAALVLFRNGADQKSWFCIRIFFGFLVNVSGRFLFPTLSLSMQSGLLFLLREETVQGVPAHFEITFCVSK